VTSRPGLGEGNSGWAMVDESTPAVQTGFGLCALEPRCAAPPHAHSNEDPSRHSYRFVRDWDYLKGQTDA
jgi:hypothetical protein